jgi:hypothetical protein
MKRRLQGSARYPKDRPWRPGCQRDNPPYEGGCLLGGGHLIANGLVEAAGIEPASEAVS